MKKKGALILLIMALTTLVMGCGSDGNGDEVFSPKGTVDWICTSGPGGGSDIFSRQITDIMTKDNLAGDANFIVNNKTDGSGEVGRNEVAHLKAPRADTTLLTFNSGDLMPMVENTANRSSNFNIIAIMAVDKQLLYKSEYAPYETFEEVIEAAIAGKTVVIGGSKGDDIATYNALIEELEISGDILKYITYDSTSEAIAAALGGHADYVMSKPAAANEYVASGDLAPVLALSTERFEGNLADAPTLSEVGDYDDVEVPVWRGVAAAGEMSDKVIQFYSDALQKVSETDAWKTEYIEKNLLISNYMNHEEATEYVAEFEKLYLAQLGIEE